MKRFTSLISALVLGIGAGSAWAKDVLVFPNGDRLSGKLIAEGEGVFRFAADVLGEIEVPVDEAAVIREPVEEVAEVVVPELEPEAEPEPETVAEIVEEAIEATPLPRPPWTGRFDLGYTWQSGRAEKNELSVRGQANRKEGGSDYQAIGEFLYGQANGEKNTHRYLGSFRWREAMSDRWFSQSLTRYEADRIREVRNRVEQNVGVGYRFLQSETAEGSVVPGLTFQYTDERGLDDRWNYLASVFQDLTWRFNPQYRFEQDFNFLVDPSEGDKFIIRFNAGVIGTLRNNISLSVRYQYLYENDTRPGVSKDDQRLITSVGYTF